MATLTGEGTARVWEVATGEPLTPPLRHRPSRGQVAFTADGRRLVLALENGDAHAWNLVPEPRPTEDLVRLAQVLAGQEIDPRGGAGPADGAATAAAWARLRRSYPADFRRTARQDIAWRREEALRAEKAGQWAAAALQLSFLLARKPQDRDLYLRRAQARAESGDWAAAAADLARANNLGARNYLTFYRMALARLAAGDGAGYRRACRAMLDQFGDASHTRARDLTAWTCALGPLPAAELARALAVIEGLLRVEPENASWLQTRAFLLYRAGRPREGLDTLARARENRGSDQEALDYLIMSLLHRAAGRHAAARQAWEQSRRAKDALEGGAANRPSWEDRAELRLLREEAAPRGAAR